MKIWKRPADLAALNQQFLGTMMAHIGLIFTQIGDETLEATLPVDARTCQPYGILHGGASAALIESVASVASFLCTHDDETIVGTELNMSHLHSARVGQTVRAVCVPLRIGRTQHVWDVRIFDGNEELCCAGRLTTRVLRRTGDRRQETGDDGRQETGDRGQLNFPAR